MPSTLTYPGVYIEEVPSGVRSILGVPTGICAFVGRARRGPVDEPVTINGFGDFERLYGGLWTESRLGYAVKDFFRNGGGQAIIVRVFNSTGLATDDAQAADFGAGVKVVSDAVAGAADKDAALAAVAALQPQQGDSEVHSAGLAAGQAAVAAKGTDDQSTKDDLKAASDGVPPRWDRMRLTVGGLTLAARDPGAWATSLRGRIDTSVQKGVGKDLAVPGDDDTKVFHLTITDAGSGQSEQFLNVTLGPSKRPMADVIKERSSLVTVVGNGGEGPDPTKDPWAGETGDTVYDKKVADLAAGIGTSEADGTKAADALRTTLLDFLDPIGANQEVLDAVRNAGAAAVRAAAKPDDVRGFLAKVEAAVGTALEAASTAAVDGVGDGDDLEFDTFAGPGMEQAKTGLYALKRADLFNLLVIPPYTGSGEDLDVEVDLVAEAATLCEAERALLIVDPPSSWTDKNKAKAGIGADPDEVGTKSRNAAIFFPRIRQPNPLHEMRTELFTPSGVVAGVMARTDRERGVWKAPAGLDATLNGVPELAVKLTAEENGELNPLGVNCLRSMPPGLRVVWGSRTLQGDDRFASEWKYIPIRRLALFIEESLFRGTQWVVFEPNDEPLWASIRLNVGAFMHGLFRQGAFQGGTPQEAYFVKCDKDSNPQEDVDRGIVNILVGFAPLKPAEFVVIKLQQIAGQLQA
jgi:phage tail sheath protein FI